MHVPTRPSNFVAAVGATVSMFDQSEILFNFKSFGAFDATTEKVKMQIVWH